MTTHLSTPERLIASSALLVFAYLLGLTYQFFGGVAFETEGAIAQLNGNGAEYAGGRLMSSGRALWFAQVLAVGVGLALWVPPLYRKRRALFRWLGLSACAVLLIGCGKYRVDPLIEIDTEERRSMVEVEILQKQADALLRFAEKWDGAGPGMLFIGGSGKNASTPSFLHQLPALSTVTP